MLVTVVEYKGKYVCVGLRPLESGYQACYLYTFKGKRYQTKEEAEAQVQKIEQREKEWDEFLATKNKKRQNCNLDLAFRKKRSFRLIWQHKA